MGNIQWNLNWPCPGFICFQQYCLPFESLLHVNALMGPFIIQTLSEFHLLFYNYKSGRELNVSVED